MKGEGYAKTVEEADEKALADLISQIMISVKKDIVITDDELITNNDITTQSYIQSKVESYSQATLTNTQKLVLETSPDFHVVRYVKRSEVQKIFEGRVRKVKEYVNLADRAEQRLKLDDALREYYWAYSLLKTVPHADTVVWKDPRGEEHTLSVWLPIHIGEIFDDIDVTVGKRDGIDLELHFTYDGKKVRSLDYTYDYSNGNWSNLYSAKDGIGIAELAPNININRIGLRFEYMYAGQALIDKDVASVVKVVKVKDIGGSQITVNIPKDKPQELPAQQAQVQPQIESAQQTQPMQQRQTQVAASNQTNINQTNGTAFNATLSEDDPRFTHYCGTMTVLTTAEAADFQNTIDAVVNATRDKKYEVAKKYFTSEGALLYDTLIHYGSAKVLNYTGCAFTRMGNQVIARSVPMSFTFQRNSGKTFIEDVVFTLNQDGKIDNICFGLDKDAANDVMSQSSWPEEARQVIINFLENYKTAYGLKRLEYLRSTFADDAVIITGKIVTKVERMPGDQSRYSTNRYVVRTQQTKEQYLNNLAKCFHNNEYVNIRFGNTSVVKAGKGGDVYGIQLKQDYYSTHYGDTGYLFLMVNMNDREHPTILVRTWQDEIDPELGRPYGLPDF